MIYLDCNATTPLEPELSQLILNLMLSEYGNEGSRTHEYGSLAKRVVQKARQQVADLLNGQPEEVIFTSGATESNNLAILGLSEYGINQQKNHIITTSIEHKAVLEPIAELEKRGYEISYVAPDSSGRVDAEEILKKIKPTTLLISVMHVNNETGIIQPIARIAEGLEKYDIFFHTDAAQSFGKIHGELQNKRIDLVSFSGHKIFAPKGIGGLLIRKRNMKAPPLKPLFFGGGQERGLRPGTLPTHLIAALGQASELSMRDHDLREKKCREIQKVAIDFFQSIGGIVNGKKEYLLPTTLNIHLPGIRSEAAMVVLKSIVAISNGSACTSSSYEPSHVLKEHGLNDAELKECIRVSWCHLTPKIPWVQIKNALEILKN